MKLSLYPSIRKSSYLDTLKTHAKGEPKPKPAPMKPRLVDFNRLYQEFGIPRGKARQLVRDGLIKVLKLPSYNQTGQRSPNRIRVLVVVSSVEEYLNSLATEQGVSL
jgi:hypothetical protein